MRIGIEAQRIFRQKKHGMDIVALEVLRQLQQEGENNQYLAYTQPDDDNKALHESRHLQVRKLGPALYPIWEQKLLPEAARHDKLDLLHCTSNTAPLSPGMPMIVTIHDIIYLEKWMISKGSWYQRTGNLYRRWNVPRIAGKAAMILTVSNYERERIIERLKIAPEKVRTVYNACGDHFTPATDAKQLSAFRIKMNLPERFVLFLGNTNPKKNLPNVIRAMALLQERRALDFTLVMPDFGQSNLERMLHNLGCIHLLPHIQLTGYIPNRELPNLYRLSTLFLYPSLRESFGIPILEAMACGTPVITSNTSAMPEVAGEGALMIDPEQPEDLAAMITKVMSSKTIREQAVAYGLKRSAQFSWKQTARQTAAIYREVLNV